MQALVFSDQIEEHSDYNTQVDEQAFTQVFKLQHTHIPAQ